MSRMRRWHRSLLLHVGAATTVAACGSGSTPAASPSTTVLTLASGDLTCSTIIGTLTFSPPLTTKGGSAESTAISLRAAGCRTTGSNVAGVTGGSGSATISAASNSCTGLINSRVLTIDMAWAPSTIRGSVVRFSGFDAAANTSGGGEGFTLPNAGGTATVTGSFAGSDRGASSTAATYSSRTGTQLLAACGSSGGLPSIQITSGTLNLK